MEGKRRCDVSASVRTHFKMITYTPVQERHSGFTVGPGLGGDCARDPVSNLGWHGRPFWSIPDPHFIPPGQQMPKVTFLQGSPIQGWQDQSHMAWHSKRNGGGESRVFKVHGVFLRWIQSHSRLTTLPACLSLSPVFHREVVSFPFPFFAPGHKQSRTKDERKMQWGGVRRGRDI